MAAGAAYQSGWPKLVWVQHARGFRWSKMPAWPDSDLSVCLHVAKGGTGLCTAYRASPFSFRYLSALPSTAPQVGTGSLPEPFNTEVRNQGGGHFNHQLFWKVRTDSCT